MYSISTKFVLERICDTIYQYDHVTTDDFVCEEIIKPKCDTKWETLYDKTCKTTYRFDCRSPMPNIGYGAFNLMPMQQVHRFESPMGNNLDPYKTGQYSQNPYGPHQANKGACRKIPKKRCYTTPRRVKIQECREVKENSCQKVKKRVPRPTQKQSCRDEPYEKCEMEKQHQITMMPTPIFEEVCDDEDREICDFVGKTTLELRCVNQTRHICEWGPKRGECNKIPKEHCYKAPYQEKTTDCDEKYTSEIGPDSSYGQQVNGPGKYDAPHQTAYAQGVGGPLAG